MTASVRGAGTFTSGGQRFALAVDARATAEATSGRFTISGGGCDVTGTSRTITSITRSGSTATVTGTLLTASGRTLPFRLVVLDRPGGRDQVTVGNRTVGGTLRSGNITLG